MEHKSSGSCRVPPLSVSVAGGHVRDGRDKIIQCVGEKAICVPALLVAPG